MTQTNLSKPVVEHKYNPTFKFELGKSYRVKFLRFGQITPSKFGKGNYRYATVKIENLDGFYSLNISQPLRETPTSLWWQLDKLNASLGNLFFERYFNVIVWPRGKYFDVIILEAIGYVAERTLIMSTELVDGKPVIYDERDYENA